MTILNHIWPWSKIRRLERELEAESEFSSACLTYLDSADPGTQHVRFNNELHCVGVDYWNKIIFRPGPRDNFIITGIEKP